MRLTLVALLILVGTAFATRDFTVRAGRIATWKDEIIVEMSSSSAEAEGKDLAVWWSIQRPPGTEQARIEGVNARPKLVRSRRELKEADDARRTGSPAPRFPHTAC